MPRNVLFVEVPSFYAMVERSLDPSLAERPVIVGGDPRKRGWVQAATPDALADGVAPDMPVSEAMGLCPRARLLRTDMGRYREASRRLFACFRRALARPEPFGLAAAFFDVSAVQSPVDDVVAKLAKLVEGALGLPLRAGMGSGKFLARIAAEEEGPGLLRVVSPGAEAHFLRDLPASRLEGVGEKTAGTLAELGARSIGEVVALGRERLEEAFGGHGLRIFLLASGADDSPVRGVAHPQSVSREATLRNAEGRTVDLALLTDQVQDLVRQVDGELRDQALSPAKITLKVRFADSTQTTRSASLKNPPNGANELLEAAIRLLGRTQAGSLPVRGLGIQLGKLTPLEDSNRQLDLFSPQS